MQKMEEPIPANSPINKRRRRPTEEDTNKVLHDEDIAYVSGDFRSLQILDKNYFITEDSTATNTIRRNFEEEIEAALRDVSFGVQKIQRLQPSGYNPIPKDIFLFKTKKNKKNGTELIVDNFDEPLVEIITLENSKFVVTCSRSGFQVVYEEDRTNDSSMKEETMDTEDLIYGNFTSFQDQIFESLPSLLMEVSPSFKNQFYQTVSAKLLMVQLQQQEESYDESMKEEL